MGLHCASHQLDMVQTLCLQSVCRSLVVALDHSYVRALCIEDEQSAAGVTHICGRRDPQMGDAHNITRLMLFSGQKDMTKVHEVLQHVVSKVRQYIVCTCSRSCGAAH
jgi:hypothetical protein